MKKLFCILFVSTTTGGFSQNVGIGTQTPLQRLHVVGNAIISDKLGIGVSQPLAPIHLRNEVGNKRILLYDAFGDDNQYFGFGINPGVLRYQSDGDHVFYTGQSAISSLEVIRLKENGNVGIGNANPQSRLSVNGNAEVSGNAEVTGNTVISGNLAVGIPSATYRLDVGGTARINGDLNVLSNNAGGTWFYLTNTSITPTGWKMIANPDGKLLFYNTGNNSAITALQNGRVGIGTNQPASRLHVAGDETVDGNLAIGGVLGFGHQVVSIETNYTAHAIAYFTINCPANTKLLSGGGGYGGSTVDIASNIDMIYNGPDPDLPSTRWRIYIWNKNDVAVPIKIQCICANIY